MTVTRDAIIIENTPFRQKTMAIALQNIGDAVTIRLYNLL